MERYKLLVSDPIAESGLNKLKEFFEVDYRPGLPKEELLNIIGDYQTL